MRVRVRVYCTLPWTELRSLRLRGSVSSRFCGASNELQVFACWYAATCRCQIPRPEKAEWQRRAAEDPAEREWQRSARASGAPYHNEEVECGRELGRWITPFRRCGPGP